MARSHEDGNDLVGDHPLHIHWDVTGRCNLNCRHCRATSEKMPAELSTNEAMSLIDEISALGPEWMSFDGGEPLLRTDLFDLISYASERSLFTYLLTNGTKLSPPACNCLRSAGIGSVQVSLDGLRKSNDYIRGEDSYDKAISGIRSLLAAGIRASIRMTVSHLNIADAPALLDTAIEIGAAAFGIRRVVCVGHARAGDQWVDPQEYLAVVKNVVKRGAGRIPVHIGTDPVLIPVTDVVRQIQRQTDSLEVLAGCGAGISLLHIGSDGTLFPCGVLPLPLGNVRTDDIVDVWRHHPLLRQLRNRDGLRDPCGACRYRYVCGGCRAAAWAHSGDYLGPDPLCLLPYSGDWDSRADEQTSESPTD